MVCETDTELDGFRLFLMTALSGLAELLLLVWLDGSSSTQFWNREYGADKHDKNRQKCTKYIAVCCLLFTDLSLAQLASASLFDISCASC